MAVVYIIYFEDKTKVYVGSTINFKVRKYTHLNKLTLNRNESSILQHAFNKYGIEKINFEIFEDEIPNDDVRAWEQAAFEFFADINDNPIDDLPKKPYYNISRFAGSVYGYKHTAESKKVISNKNKGKKLSEETKKKISISHVGLHAGPKNYQYNKRGKESANFGKNHTEESRLKMSLSQSGEKNAMFGKKHSQKTKSLMSEQRSGENHPLFGKRGILSPNYGRKASEEAKRKFSISRKQTHCKNNHEFVEGSFYSKVKDGKERRICKPCSQKWHQEYHKKNYKPKS